jgi:3',5'-cyclic AMP phosphodiesterase CpdA
MKLVIFSDIHYSSDHSLGVWKGVKRKLINYSELLLDKLITEINQQKPDAVIYLGDLIEDVDTLDEDISNVKYILRILKNIQPNLYLVAGNHDLRHLNSRTLADLFGYDNLSYSVDVAGCHLVVLSPEVVDIDGHDGGISRTRNVSKKDLQWLKQDLANNKLPSIVFTHYGLAEDEMTGNAWFEGASEKALQGNRRAIKDILQSDKNLMAVFSGHQHWTKKITEQDVDYYLIGSLTENINNDGVPDAVWFEITVENNEIKVIEHHIKLW